VRPDQALGAASAQVTVDQRGVFRVKDLVELVVTSPRTGYATLLWLDPKAPQIFPEAVQAPAAERHWQVTAGKPTPFDAPLPKPRSEFPVLIVITPQPSAAQVRKAVPVNDKDLLGDVDRIQKLLTEQLLGGGQSWVAFGQVTLALERPSK
jgi:hypothetical protein